MRRRLRPLRSLDDASQALVLALGGAVVSWVIGPLLLFVTRPRDYPLVAALLGFVELAAIVAVVWGVYFGIRVLTA